MPALPWIPTRWIPAVAQSPNMPPGEFNPEGSPTEAFRSPRISKASLRDDQKAKLKDQQMKDLPNDPTLVADQQRLLDYMRQNPAEFVDFNIPWSVNLSYSLYFSRQFKSDYSGFENKFTSNANFSGSFNLTPKWNFSMNGYFDLDTKKLQTLQMSISREMHCWQLSISVNPKGRINSFLFDQSQIRPATGPQDQPEPVILYRWFLVLVGEVVLPHNREEFCFQFIGCHTTGLHREGIPCAPVPARNKSPYRPGAL